MNTGVQEAIPVLPALFRCPKDLDVRRILLIEFLCYGFPVNLGVIGDEVSEDFGLLLRPFMSDKFDFFETEPLKLALLP